MWPEPPPEGWAAAKAAPTAGAGAAAARMVGRATDWPARANPERPPGPRWRAGGGTGGPGAPRRRGDSPPGGGVRGPTGNRAGAASCRMMLDRVSGAGGDPAASLRRVGHQMAGSCITSAPIWGAAPAPSNTKTPAVRHTRCWGPCVLARWVSRGHIHIIPHLMSNTTYSCDTYRVFSLQRVTKRAILRLVNNIGIVAWRCKHAQQLDKRYTD